MNFDDLEDEYLKLICQAMKKVSREYFEIKTAGNASSKKRERVYCYELYHQMRLLQEKEFRDETYSINAEIDKSGHKKIRENFNPDMIIHKQGQMNNHIVIEVKTVNIGSSIKQGIIKDFGTLKCMLACYNYEYGVFILTGQNIKWFKDTILDELDYGNLDAYADNIYIFTQEQINSKIDIVTLKELKIEIYEK